MSQSGSLTGGSGSGAFHFLTAAYASTTANLTATYANGASGVGATLTNSGALAAFSTDGTTPPLNSRILVQFQSTTYQNGIYTLTTAGSGAVAWVLTRATDYDQPADIQPGDLVPVTNGSLYGNTVALETATVAAVGVSPIMFQQFSIPVIIYPLSASLGGTGVSSPTAHSLLVAEGSSAFTALGVATNGQLPIGSTGADPVLATLTSSDSSLTITNGAGSINLQVPAGGGLSLGAFGTVPNANGLTLTAGVLNMQPANGTNPGGVSTTTQTFAGVKTFSSAPILSSLTGILIGNGASAVSAQTVTQYNALIGGASNGISSVAPSATSGVPLISQGSSANPAFGTAVVAGGGTGSTSFNTQGVVVSGATGTTALASLSLSSGQVVIGGSGAPAAATLTAGTGVSISNGNNSITISGSGVSVVKVTTVRNSNSPYSVLGPDNFLSCDTTTGAITIRLPNGTATGRVFTIKDANGLAGTNNITVTTPGGIVLIDAASTYVMNINYQAISVVFDGTGYEVF